ncbi:MAG: class I SAM-dependent methyltransferase [Candidatus Nealsonbacteria bacterium]|nr:class I SAM-dependent methyltransferase [Candidatus Nealsonbacteria bacterium]
MDSEYAKYLLSKTRQDYNLIAEEFSRKREGIWEETRFLFDDYLQKGERVLDLGCGNGRYYPVFQEKRVDHFGVDNSKELIGIAKNKFPGGNFQVAEAQNLPFAEGFFDKVYSIAVLHHIPSTDLRIKFLKEAQRVLRPGGLIILTAWKFHRVKEYYFFFKYTLLKLIGNSKFDWKDIFEPWGKKAQRYYHWFSGKELEGLVRKAGFEIKKSGIIRNEKGNRQNIYIVAEKTTSP